MTSNLIVQGRVLEIDRKDGESAQGLWTRWGLRIEGHDESGTHWYSTFDDSGSTIRTGQVVRIAYRTKANPQKEDSPYRNVLDFLAVQDAPATAPQADQPLPPVSYQYQGLASLAPDAPPDKEILIAWSAARHDAVALVAAFQSTFLDDEPTPATIADAIAELTKQIVTSWWPSGPSPDATGAPESDVVEADGVSPQGDAGEGNPLPPEDPTLFPRENPF